MKRNTMLYFFIIILTGSVLTYEESYAIKGGTPPTKVQDLVDEEIIDAFKSEGLEIGEKFIDHIKNYQCYEYDDYVILVKNHTEVIKGEVRLTVGKDILVKIRKNNAEAENLCEMSNAHQYFKIEEWAGYFDGIFDNYLFVEIGTGPTLRSIAIYDLTKQERIFEATYDVSGPVRINDKQNFVFNRKLEKEIHSIEELRLNKETLSRAEELEDCIKRLGGVALYERIILNLKTLTEERTGIISYGCMQ